MNTLLFVPGDTPRLLAGMRWVTEEYTDAAIFATDDGGRTWEVWDGGLAAQYDNRQWAFSLAMDPGDPERLYAGQSVNVLRSLDGGRTWSYSFGGPHQFALGVNALLVSPARDGRIWAGGESPFFSAFMLRSDDWGDSWTQVLSTRGGGNIFDIEIDPLNTSRLWAAASGGVILSDDYGDTWTNALLAFDPIGEGGYITGVPLLNDGLYAVGQAFRAHPDIRRDLVVHRSVDGGTTWTAVPVPRDASGAIFAEPDGLGGMFIGTLETTPDQRSGLWRFQP